jgi:hypothetical protein
VRRDRPIRQKPSLSAGQTALSNTVISSPKTFSEAFFDDKAAAKVKTAGLEYSPHYLRKSRQQNAAPDVRGIEYTGSKTP